MLTRRADAVLASSLDDVKHLAKKDAVLVIDFALPELLSPTLSIAAQYGGRGEGLPGCCVNWDGSLRGSLELVRSALSIRGPCRCHWREKSVCRQWCLALSIGPAFEKRDRRLVIEGRFELEDVLDHLTVVVLLHEPAREVARVLVQEHLRLPRLHFILFIR